MSILRTGTHGHSGPGVVPISSMGGGAATMGYYQKVLGYGPLVYFPQWEAAGAVSDEIINGWDGAYVGVTLGQPGIGDGNSSPFFDGLNDYNNIWTAALAAAFNGSEGTMAIWGRVNAVGVWADGADRNFMQCFVNAANWLYIRKDNVVNRIRYYYEAGGVVSAVNAAIAPTADWMHVALTWSASTPPTGEMMAYYNGVQVGATQVGLGAWAGVPIAAQTNIGCNDNTIPDRVFHGWLAHGAIWTRALPPAEIADLAVI